MESCHRLKPVSEVFCTKNISEEHQSHEIQFKNLVYFSWAKGSQRKKVSARILAELDSNITIK